MNELIIGLALVAALFVGFHIGCEVTMRAVRGRAAWRLSGDEYRDLVRLMDKVLNRED